MANLTPEQLDILVRTVLGEARGEGIDGMEAVAQVIRNRTNSGRFPSDPSRVALQPNQFSVWNEGAGGGKTSYNPNSQQYKTAAQAVERVFSGQSPDRTNGALFYHTPSVSPNWASEANRYGTTKLGNHIFYNGRPTPPDEIPNQVASLTDTVGPRVAPNPVTISPDLGQMRNPVMSPSARAAQVTPAPPPLPQRRPSAPDIVTPSMNAINAQRGNVNAMRGVDMLAATQNPVTPRLTAAGDNIYSYHIPDMTPTTITGGMGSLTPSPARVRLPDIPPSRLGEPASNVAQSPKPLTALERAAISYVDPTSGIGKPPVTRSVASVAFNSKPSVAQAAPLPSTADLRAEQRAEQALQRISRAPAPVVETTPNTGIGPAPVPKIQDRLAAGQWGLPAIVGAPTQVAAPINIVPPQPRVIAPIPADATRRPSLLAAAPLATVQRPIQAPRFAPPVLRAAVQPQRAPLRVVVQADPSPSLNPYVVNGSAVQSGLSNAFAGTAASGFGSDSVDRWISSDAPRSISG